MNEFALGFFDVAADVFAEAEDAGVGDAVIDVKAFLAPLEDTGADEGLEVARNVRLIGPRFGDEGVYGLFAPDQSMDDPQPHRLPQGPEAGGHQLEEGLRWRELAGKRLRLHFFTCVPRNI